MNPLLYIPWSTNEVHRTSEALTSANLEALGVMRELMMKKKMMRMTRTCPLLRARTMMKKMRRLQKPRLPHLRLKKSTKHLLLRWYGKRFSVVVSSIYIWVT